MLLNYESGESFLEAPVWTDSRLFQSSLQQQIALSLEEIAPAKTDELFVGRQIGVYQLTAELGHGLVIATEQNHTIFLKKP